MEPIKGGSLAEIDQHEEIRELFQKMDPSQTPASWALRYAASLDGVLVVLSGMSRIEQMKENEKILMHNFQPLTQKEKEMLKKAAHIMEKKGPVGCTGCHYCTDNGCPAGINIPRILNCLNMLHQYKNLRTSRLAYYQATEHSSPRDCLQCRSCEGVCPQKLSIVELLQKTNEELYAGESIDVWANH